MGQAEKGGGSRWPDRTVSRTWINQTVKPSIDIPHLRAPADEVMTVDHAATDYVKTMSHELHTPLHVIIGLCQLLERDQEPGLSSMQRDAVHRMERNAQTLLQTVNHLLSCLRRGRFD